MAAGGGKFSALGWSLLVHVAIAAGLLVTFRFAVPVAQQTAGEVIQAVAIDAEALAQRERDKAEAARRAEEARQAELRREREARERAEAERRRQEEAARQAELRRREEVRRQAEAEARSKAEAEQRRRAEEEARRKAEAERQRLAAEQAARAEREAEMRRSMETEAQRMAAVRAGKLAEYQALITDKVMRNWLPPPDLGEDFHCAFQVRQIPGGEVVNVQAGECDSEVLRRSAEAAIWKASPLPPPPDPALFDQYVNVIFQPED